MDDIPHHSPQALIESLELAWSKTKVSLEVKDFLLRWNVFKSVGFTAEIVSSVYNIKYKGSSGFEGTWRMKLKLEFTKSESGLYWKTFDYDLKVSVISVQVDGSPVLGEIQLDLVKLGHTMASKELGLKSEVSSFEADSFQFAERHVENALNGNALTLVATINILCAKLDEPEVDASFIPANESTNDEACKITSLSEMFADRELISEVTDFDLVSRHGENVPTLRAFLAAQSKIFREMMKMMTGKGVIVMAEFGTVTLRIFTHFLLTNELNLERAEDDQRDDDEAKDFDIVRNLLVLGNRYEVTNLVQVAEKWLREHIEESNVSEVVKVADLVNSDGLMNKCVGHFVRNRADMKRSIFEETEI